ncbi:MAG: hypothetical protein AAF772_10150 [Acidobacteriota bacterium]
MMVRLRQADQELDLAFAARADARAFFTGAAQGAFLLHLDTPLAPPTRLTVRTATQDGFSYDFQADAVQVLAGAQPGLYGVVFQPVDGDAATRGIAIADGVATPEATSDADRTTGIAPYGSPADDDAAAEAPAMQAAPPEPAPTKPATTLAQRAAARRKDARETGEAESRGELSPMFRIKKMNPNERFRLAMRASRTERQILIRDSAPQVLLGLLSHPQLEDQEVLDVAKSRYASAGVLQRIADNGKWMGNPEIRLTIVKNPKTAPQVALKFLPQLRTNELRPLARGDGAREALRKAALKLYLGRIGKPP